SQFPFFINSSSLSPSILTPFFSCFAGIYTVSLPPTRESVVVPLADSRSKRLLFLNFFHVLEFKTGVSIFFVFFEKSKVLYLTLKDRSSFIFFSKEDGSKSA